MKYTPIFVPVILIMGLIAVRLYRPPAIPTGAAQGAAIVCDGAVCR